MRGTVQVTEKKEKELQVLEHILSEKAWKHSLF